MRSILLATLTTALLATSSTTTQAQSVSDVQAQIQALLEKVATLQAQLQQLNNLACNFSRDLFFGIKGEDVKCLQQYLKVTATGFFGPLTKKAVVSWQTANNISPALGYFGQISRNKYKELTKEVTAAPATVLIPAPAPAQAPTPTPAPAPVSPASLIKTGSGVVANNGYLNIGTGTFLYSGSGLENRGHLYPGDPKAFIGDMSGFEDASTCENTKAYSYRGLSNVCQFTDPAQFTFTQLSGSGVRFYDKNAIKNIYSCSTGIVVFKQDNRYGAIDFEQVDKENNLHYRYWLDQSGGTNFGSLCSSRADTAKLASLLDSLKFLLQKLKGLVR